LPVTLGLTGQFRSVPGVVLGSGGFLPRSVAKFPVWVAALPFRTSLITAVSEASYWLRLSPVLRGEPVAVEIRQDDTMVVSDYPSGALL
jgi:hypothetical protein